LAAESQNDVIAECAAVSRVYSTGEVQVHALRDVSLTVHRGEFLAVVGPSGSGKSTLMNILGCLDRPTSGRYFFEGREVSRLADEQQASVRNKKVGFVFQSFNLMPRATAVENVYLPLLYSREKRRRDAALEALARVGLSQRAHHRPNQLSGGEQQRVAIARALVNSPSMLLADEPTGNLDTQTGAEIVALLEELHREGMTLVVVTHSLEIATRAGRVVTFRDGRVVSDAASRPGAPS
jgi:putative ABC transport system ATP-binding protein